MRKIHLRSYVLYVASAWGFLQALDFFSGKFGWSPLLFNYGLILLSAGLLALFIRNQFETRRGDRLFSSAEIVINSSILILALISCVLISSGKSVNKSKPAHQSPKPRQPQALEHFLKAKYFLNLTDDVSQIDSAANHLERSLQYEPGIALTHAMLSQAYTRKLFMSTPRRRGLRRPLWKRSVRLPSTVLPPTPGLPGGLPTGLLCTNSLMLSAFAIIKNR